MTSLANKIALITGAGAGMGRAHALLMAERGADIIVADIDVDCATMTADRVRALGRRAHVEAVDMADVAAVRRMVEHASDAFGPVNILVNNAGFEQRAELHEVTEEDYDRMFAVHVRGSFFATQAVIPMMKAARSGKIINISSILGMTGAPAASHYCGAKAALQGLTRAWAKEFAPWNIHVNTVSPGGVMPGPSTNPDDAELLRQEMEKVPLGRYCAPGEVSYAVAFLASSEADFITGQNLSPNGGETIVGI